jgi:hypothetical protein
MKIPTTSTSASTDVDHPSQSVAEILSAELRAAGAEFTLPGGGGDAAADLKAVHQAIHALSSPRSALCLSGGGIRSASFGLGILQGLAGAGLLGRFDYLSTVSGGGYIGGWFSAWVHNHPRGQAGVIEELSAPPSDPLEPECAPLRHVRAFSNYLTPRIGVLSADAWTLGATALRDMLLNWIVLLSWLAVVLLIPRFTVFSVLARPEPWMLGALLAGAFLSLATAMAYAGIDLPSLGNDRRPQGWFVRRFLLPMMWAAVFFCAWWAGFRNTSAEAGPLMASGRGLVLVQIFVGLATGAGCVAAAGWLAWRDRSRRDSKLSGRGLVRIAGMAGVTMVFTGAVTGFFAWSIAQIFPNPAEASRNFACFAVPLLLAMFFVANTVFNGVTSWWTNDDDREWWGRAAGWLWALIIGWASLHALVLWAPGLVAQVKIGEIGRAVLAACGGAFGLAAAIVGFSRGSVAKTEGSAPPAWGRLLAAAALGFFVMLSFALSLLLDAPSGRMLENPGVLWDAGIRRQFVVLLVAIGVLAGIGVAMGFFINVNKFSLHAMYRSRLIRAFLGASRAKRQPHWFTGFDPADNIPAHRLKPGRPFHIVNIALNLVQGGQLAWQERKAASFTVSRLHCGSWPVGYRPAEFYGNGISLGTAIAVSGAAASPNQGYHSSPIVAFLMTLFNLRLGWWLGNPGSPGEHTWRCNGPLHAALPLFSEALGNTTAAYPYVNLSDGGHFENLGLYEMVLRRCRHIVVVDAGCDADYVFEDLGNAIRKIRIDFGVPIDIQVVSPRQAGASASYFAIGTIRYSAVDGAGTDGQLLYIKPVICGAEPADVAHYAAAHPDFPHESTNDQWFTESQMESYRALGQHVVTTILARRRPADVATLFAELGTKLEPVADSVSSAAPPMPPRPR